MPDGEKDTSFDKIFGKDSRQDSSPETGAPEARPSVDLAGETKTE
jgi:hypothetical protein